jgi:hypothetical protein
MMYFRNNYHESRKVSTRHDPKIESLPTITTPGTGDSRSLSDLAVITMEGGNTTVSAQPSHL